MTELWSMNAFSLVTGTRWDINPIGLVPKRWQLTNFCTWLGSQQLLFLCSHQFIHIMLLVSNAQQETCFSCSPACLLHTSQNLQSTNLFSEALTLQSSTSMRIKSILNIVLCDKISLVLKCCSLTIKVQIKVMVCYSNSSPSCQNRHFAQISASVCH